MNKMNTCVFVRFSVKMKSFRNWNKEPSQKRTMWLEKRISLFQKITLESLLNQTHKPDCICLLIDKDDEDIIHKSFGHIPEIMTVIIPENTNISQQERIVGENLKDNYYNQPLLVMRLDSDDLLFSDYIEEIVKKVNAKTPNGTLLISTSGLLTNLKYYQSLTHNSPPFVSVFYNQYKGQLDLGGNHTKIL